MNQQCLANRIHCYSALIFNVSTLHPAAAAAAAIPCLPTVINTASGAASCQQLESQHSKCLTGSITGSIDDCSDGDGCCCCDAPAAFPSCSAPGSFPFPSPCIQRFASPSAPTPHPRSAHPNFPHVRHSSPSSHDESHLCPLNPKSFFWAVVDVSSPGILTTECDCSETRNPSLYFHFFNLTVEERD